MARVTETTVKVPAPPRTFTVEVSEDELISIAAWSWGVQPGSRLFHACPGEYHDHARATFYEQRDELLRTTKVAKARNCETGDNLIRTFH